MSNICRNKNVKKKKKKMSSAEQYCHAISPSLARLKATEFRRLADFAHRFTGTEKIPFRLRFLFLSPFLTGSWDGKRLRASSSTKTSLHPPIFLIPFLGVKFTRKFQLVFYF